MGELVAMAKILILYHTRTGNTEIMAKAIAKGAREIFPYEVDVKRFFEAPKDLNHYEAIIMGTPNYYHILTHNISEFLEELAFRKVNLKDKIGAVFGSYGWSHECPNMLLEVLKNKFEMNVIEPPLFVKYTPDEKGIRECQEFGKKIANKCVKCK